RLVEWVHTSGESGNGYRLADYPLIWLDVDAISFHMKRACELEAHGQEALSHWQAVYQLGMRGPFLAEETYSEWAISRREDVEGALWQSVRALWRYYLTLPERRGEEEALRLLRHYWLSHVTNEDAARL